MWEEGYIYTYKYHYTVKFCFMLSVYPENSVNQYTESPIMANTVATDNI